MCDEDSAKATYLLQNIIAIPPYEALRQACPHDECDPCPPPGREERALKVGDVYYDELMMRLVLRR